MPYQNRVKPTGEIFTPPQSGREGTRMGNRGRLHGERLDSSGCKVLLRRYQGKSWIICQTRFTFPYPTPPLDDKIMPRGSYTRLFFLDEAVAFAAGHRPCAYCSRPRFNEFRRAWLQANPDLVSGATPSIKAIDAVLHAERLAPGGAKRTYPELLERLPDGCFVSLEPGDDGWLVLGGELLQWTYCGYARRIPRPAGLVVAVLTPPSVVRMFQGGFCPDLHPTAGVAKR